MECVGFLNGELRKWGVMLLPVIKLPAGSAMYGVPPSAGNGAGGKEGAAGQGSYW